MDATGDDVIVAPICEYRQRQRAAWLPPGKWTRMSVDEEGYVRPFTGEKLITVEGGPLQINCNVALDELLFFERAKGTAAPEN